MRRTVPTRTSSLTVSAFFLALLSYSETPSYHLSETQGHSLFLFVQSLLVLSDEFPHLRKEGAGCWKTRNGRKQVSGYWFACWVSVHSRKLGAREAGSCGASWAIRVSSFTALPGPSKQRQSGGKPCALSWPIQTSRVTGVIYNKLP